ncbi:MAG: hypothetical protein EA356_04065 [Geminicoccaceae bacterium]|nr:MAG: hypothetical protein EA356_04065 [Geminicoccaceae bacterium]
MEGTPLAFTSVSALQPGGLYELSAGDAREAGFTFNADETFASAAPSERVNATYRFRLDADGNVSAAQLRTDNVEITALSPNDFFIDAFGQYFGFPDDDNDVVVVVNAPVLGFEYMSFGFWASEGANLSGTGGAGAFGALTPVANIPSSGTASYDGVLSGILITPDAFGSVVDADVALTADFAASSLGFNSTNTVVFDFFGVGTAEPDLNLSGTLAITGNRFAGTVNTAAPGGSGVAEGSFYGPSAQEAAGIFDVRGTGAFDGAVFYGGFGAVRQ